MSQKLLILNALVIVVFAISGCVASTQVGSPTLQPIGDPCNGVVQFPQVSNPTRWVPGYKILCPPPDGRGYYEKWIPGHYE